MPGTDARASLLQEALVALTALGGAAVAVAHRAHAALALALLAPLALEAWGPRAPRTAAAAKRRIPAFGVAAATALTLGADGPPGLRAEDVALGVALVLALLAALAVLARLREPGAAGDLDSVLESVAAFGDGAGSVLGYAAALLVLGFALLGAGVVELRATRALEPTAIRAVEGFAFEAPAPGGRPDGAGAESTLAVTEDGRPLGPAHALGDAVRELGRGRFRHDPRRVLFATSDGTDARTNGRRYVLHHAWSPPLALASLVVALASLLNARRAARAAAAIERAHPAVVAGAILAVAVAFRIHVWWRDIELTTGTLVKGVIFSDARDWYSTAADFSRNERSASMWAVFGARRPFWALLGAVFALTGPSVLVARVFNVALSALAAVFVFDGVRRVSSRPVAIAAALAQALLLYDARMDLTVMTEPFGNFFAAVTTWGFILGAELAAAEPARPRWTALAFLGAGVALGLSNLARPLTLAVAAGLPLALALVARRARTPWRRVVAGAACFGLGVALVVGPWVLRQRLVHGIWTISENTGEAWYAATNPKYGTWGGDVGALAGDRSAPERVAFYMEGVSQNLREHRMWYARHVIDELATAVRTTGPPAWVLAFAASWFVVTALGAGERGPRRGLAVAAALAVTPLALAPAPPLYAVTALGLVAAVLTRRTLALLATFHAVTLVSIALIALSQERRLTHGLEWIAATLAADLLLGALARLDGRPTALPAPGDATGSWGRTGRVLGGLGALALLLAAGGFVRALAVTGRPRQDPAAPAALASRAVAALEGDGLAPIASRLVARRVRLRPGFAIPLAAGEDLGHECPLFEPRPYPFTVSETEPEVPERYAVLAGSIPEEARGRELVLVGAVVARPGFGTTFEVLAIGICDRPGEEPRVWRRAARELAGAHEAYVRRYFERP